MDSKPGDANLNEDRELLVKNNKGLSPKLATVLPIATSAEGPNVAEIVIADKMRFAAATLTAIEPTG